MSEICISNSPAYEKLPAHRLEYIALRLKIFIRLFGIKNSDWPLDCTKFSCNSECSFANTGNARFCEMCGKPTYYYEKGLLQPWQEACDYNCVAEEKIVYV